MGGALEVERPAPDTLPDHRTEDLHLTADDSIDGVRLHARMRPGGWTGQDEDHAPPLHQRQDPLPRRHPLHATALADEAIAAYATAGRAVGPNDRGDPGVAGGRGLDGVAVAASAVGEPPGAGEGLLLDGGEAAAGLGDQG